MEGSTSNFDKAVKCVQDHAKALQKKAGDEGMLDIYGVYNLATVGKCDVKK